LFFGAGVAMRWFRKLRSHFQKRRPHRRRGVLFKPQMLEPRLALSGAPPLATNEAYVAPLDAPLQTSAPGVLANDVDPEGDLLTAQLFSTTTHGTLSLSADGAFTYVPNPGFTGVDSFAYRVFDGTNASELAAATLFVGLSDPPPAVDLDGSDSTSTGLDFSAQFTEGGPPAAIAAADASLSSDSAALVSLQATIDNRLDGANERLSADTTGTQIAAVYDAGAGRLTLSGLDSADHYLQVLKTITYQNDSHDPKTQTRQISVVVDDGAALSEPAVAHIAVIAVNDPPAATDDAWTTAADALLSENTHGVLANDSDPEDDPLTAVLVSGPQHGVLHLAADGSFAYTPATGFSGTDTFVYQASDGVARSAPATVTIRVTAPVLSEPTATNDVYQTASGVALTTAAPGVLTNDLSADGESLSAILVSPPLHGTLTLHADGSFDYAPDAGYGGMDGFSYQARQGEQSSDVASVTITVEAASSSALPTATADRYLIGSTNRLVQSSDSVLSNDGPGGGTLTATLVASPEHGSLVLNAEGTFSYTADASFRGIDHFSYRVANGSGDATAEVELVSRPAELVRKLYQDELQRDPDLAAWEDWTDQLTHGEKTLDQIAAALLNSDEYLNLSIRQFYQDYLHREADQAAVDYWRDEVWRTSGGPDKVLIGILSSPELRQAAGTTGGAWVTELYRRYLHREPEQQGYDYWTGHLADGSMDYRQVARGFVISAENDRNMADGWYSLYLGRTTTPQEQAELVTALLVGDAKRQEAAQEHIVAGAEYQSTPPQPNSNVAQRE
jgi:hypothetical protein